MNAKKAKRIRKMVYGPDGSIRNRRYGILPDGQVVRDMKRRVYQNAKKFMNGKLKLEKKNVQTTAEQPSAMS